MLHENINRAVTPKDVAALMPWQDLEGCIILTLGRRGEPNNLCMSTISIEELALLTAQLQAHLTSMLLNSLIEEVPSGRSTTN